MRLLNTLASTVLVATSATAAYTNAFGLRPRLLNRRICIQNVIGLIGLLLVLDLAAVLTIQAAYDALWWPDPA